MIDGQSSSQADIMDLALVNVADVHLGEAQDGAMKPGNDRAHGRDLLDRRRC